MTDLPVYKVVFVANDAAPSRAFMSFAAALRQEGFDVVLIANDGKPAIQTDDEIADAVIGASLVITGMSSSPDLARIEIAACEAARKAKLPFGFYSDAPHCFTRARQDGGWFTNLAGDASFYLASNNDDVKGACEMFRNASVLVTGSPLREDMAFPHFTREEVRGKTKVGPRETFVLAPGGKSAAANMTRWAVLVEALGNLVNEDFNQKFCPQVVLCTHPGDKTPYAVDGRSHEKLELYEEIVSFSPVPTRIITKDDGFTTSNLVPGADIIVECGTSIGIEGAYQRIPIISLVTGIENLQIARITGSRDLEAVKDGISRLVGLNVNLLADTIRELLTFEGFAPMRERQTICCPSPVRRGAVRRNIDTIISLVKKS